MQTAELPRIKGPEWIPATGATKRLTTGGDLQRALDELKDGETLNIEPGTYVGNFKYSGRRRVTLTTDAEWFLSDKLRAIESGVKILVANGDPLFAIAPGSAGLQCRGLEFGVTSGVERNGGLIRIGTGSEKTVEELPREIFFDECVVRGSAKVQIVRAFLLSSVLTTIRNCSVFEVWSDGQDSQAIAGWNGLGGYLIENNYLEGAGENVMFGGADPTIPDLIPSDITFVRNTCHKPFHWREGHASYDGRARVIKNLFELKNAQRVLVEGNMFDGCWRKNQIGYAINLKSKNQSGKAPWSVTRDVNFQHNIVQNASGGMTLFGVDDEFTATQMSRLTIWNNVFKNIADPEPRSAAGRLFQIGGVNDLAIVNNTADNRGSIIAVIVDDRIPVPVSERFQYIGNLAYHNDYGIKGDNTAPGTGTLNKYFPKAVCEQNGFITSHNWAPSYPSGNTFRDKLESFVGFGADLGLLESKMNPAPPPPAPPPQSEALKLIEEIEERTAKLREMLSQ